MLKGRLIFTHIQISTPRWATLMHTVERDCEHVPDLRRCITLTSRSQDHDSNIKLSATLPLQRELPGVMAIATTILGVGDASREIRHVNLASVQIMMRVCRV